jgi:hypothetical protein
MNAAAPEWLPVPAQVVASVVLLFNDKNIIWNVNHFGHQYP